MSIQNPLENFNETVAAHWRQFRPRMYKELYDANALADALADAKEQTEQAMYFLQETEGITPYEAWMEVKQMYAILPPEPPLPRQRKPRKAKQGE